MKKLILPIMLFFITTASAQTADSTSGTTKNTLFARNTWELGLTGSFSSVSVRDKGPETIISLSVSPSYYITHGFFIEPELAILINTYRDYHQSGYQLLFNAGYTFITKKSFAPYIKAGYGFGSILTLQYAGTQPTPLVIMDGDESINIVNAGVGVKWMVGGPAMIKTELNYRIQSVINDTSWLKDYNMSNVGLLLGLSVGL